MVPCAIKIEIVYNTQVYKLKFNDEIVYNIHCEKNQNQIQIVYNIHCAKLKIQNLNST